MTWLTKLIENLKIPLKVILPAIWLFSAAISLFSDKWLAKLGLLEWKRENQFILGLIFLIASCFILVYIFIYIKIKIINAISNLFMNRNTIKKFSKMSDAEKIILLKVYHSPNITCELDFCQPIVKGLIARNYLYGGGQQIVQTIPFSTVVPIKLTLQPFIYNALTYLEDKLIYKIRKIENKINKTNNQDKIKKLNLKLKDLKEIKAMYFNGEIYHG